MDNFSTHSFEISVNGNLIFHSFALRFLLPSSLKLRLNASSKHGGLGHFSPQLIKKKSHNFLRDSTALAAAGFEPGTSPGVQITGHGRLTNDAMGPLTKIYVLSRYI